MMNRNCIRKQSNLPTLCRLCIILAHLNGVSLVPQYFTRFSNGCEVPNQSKTSDKFTDITDSGIIDSYFRSNNNYKQHQGIGLK